MWYLLSHEHPQITDRQIINRDYLERQLIQLPERVFYNESSIQVEEMRKKNISAESAKRAGRERRDAEKKEMILFSVALCVSAPLLFLCADIFYL